ncbi:S1C family serine protease [Aeromicrobium wangtongii]|uniref:Trypsin-like peptidase domain-containing protein n=1 Tax=Aeromicrobium wangtongii TaxID=2969247 RepID=A0ABY5M814_9ACTN|nr:trypsin-like peptidase domain-containing protein [Aeromicrobium wangtongii]MCD9199990.1 trypsin-like peptidase domain-containing protein [Aeromicrobium wangtongii]UUP13607.1 trypsin-like peptidase domain-containing protein [Aeromicrobium wangtongii]
MTDSNDPFAANPYTPPTDRERKDTDDTDDTVVQPHEGDAPTASQAPVADAPPPPPAPPAAPASSASGAADPAAGEPTVEVPAQQETTPPAEDYTHRYPGTAEQQAPMDDPYRQEEPTVAFATSPGYGGGSGDGPATGGSTPARPGRGRMAAAGLAFLVLAAGAGYGGAWAFDQQNDDSSSSGVVSSLDGSDDDATQASLPAGTVEQVAAKVLPSVVQINVRGGQESGSGTGVILSQDGEILTNNHVVEVAGDGGTITVAFSDGSNAKAAIVGTDPKTDLAVIKAEGQSGLSPATLGSSADLRVGQEVIAIGSPFGLESTVTQGIISALNRPVSSSNASGQEQTRTTFPAVQTDAAINPGNSGGPLVDLKGRVIAINSAIKSATTSSGEAGSIGLGFAIPIDLAKSVAKQLIAGKKVAHAQIGVTVDNALGEDGITSTGAQIKEVTPDGAGAKAGLKPGDVITAVNDTLIPSSEALVAAVRGYSPGEKIDVTYTRDGKKNDVEVTLGSDGGTAE